MKTVRYCIKNNVIKKKQGVVYELLNLSLPQYRL